MKRAEKTRLIITEFEKRLEERGFVRKRKHVFESEDEIIILWIDGYKYRIRVYYLDKETKKVKNRIFFECTKYQRTINEIKKLFNERIYF